TEIDLIEFIERAISNVLTTLTFNKSRENDLVFIIQQPNEYTIFDFIEKNYDNSNTELSNIFRAFKTKNYDNIIKCTFNQDFAFKNKNVEYISAYHPLINAISNYFHRERLDRNTVYRYSLDRKNVDNKELNHVFQNGYYFLIKYDYEIKKIINGRESRFTHLKSLAINLNGEEFFSYDSENSDFFSSV